MSVAEQSRPSRARGLKQCAILLENWRQASRPSRARGLKRDWSALEVKRVSSRPSRARGLKPALNRKPPQLGVVAPLAGAWIETAEFTCCFFPLAVAPLAGAWIETNLDAKKLVDAGGRAPRGRVD